MKKNTLLKILCLVLVCVMLVPFAVACKNKGNGSGNGGSGNGGNGGTTAGEGQITISYDPGQGMLGDDEWEVVIDKGSRKTTHPVPTHDDESMMFDGWFEDETFTVAVKTAKKYDSDITLYAKWTKVNQCVDGSYNHPWGAYYIISDPDCKTAATQGRDCPNCGSVLRSEDLSQPALGHDWGKPTEAGFSNVIECRRAGCGEKEYTDFIDCTRDALGNNPSKQVELLSGDGWGMNRVSAIVDGIWDQENSAVMAGRGDEIKVEITLFTPSSFDRIYMKGRGSSTFNIYVKYQGDSEFVLLGSGSFLGDTENSKPKDERSIPFVTVDSSKVVEKVQIVMPTPSMGSDYWEECGFFRLPTDEE